MNVRLYPSKASGSVMAPPSKSMAHRYLICAALSKGESVVNNIDLSEDVKATINCLNTLGINAVYDGGCVRIKSDGLKHTEEMLLNCNESGSTLRFMIPLCLLLNKRVYLTGSEKLLSRPLSVYEEICQKINAFYLNQGGRIILQGKLASGEYELPGNISSQFITGLLFALPLLDDDTVIKMTTEVESRSYINMTLQVLHEFGIEADWKDERSLYVKGSQEYKCGSYTVEGDYSNAAFLDAFNLIGGNVETKGLREDTLQGDSIYKKYYEMLSEDKPVLDITDCPDLGPVLMALAAMKNGARFTGTKRLEIKESNRGIAMRDELKKLGCDVVVDENTIDVGKADLSKAPSEIVCGHNDHRIVMAMATMLSVTGGEIEGGEAVRKSFPDYFEKVAGLGIKLEKEV